MTFRDFKNLDYPDDMPLEEVLVNVLYKRLLDVNIVLSAYAHAIERDRQESKMRFEESCVCLTQHLSGNYKGKDRDKLNKRMISILNKSTTLPIHIWDNKYGYTEDDEKEWEDFYKTIYGNI
jgi:hypothetical protein